MIRIFDVCFSLLGLIILSPLFLLVGVLNKVVAPGPVLFKQVRVGLNGKEFVLLKFRSMYVNADKQGLLITTSGKDPRITPFGYYLRKYKIDELPQLWNVLVGDMSIVGPRPEVQKYVELYTTEQRAVLQVRPGITDTASLVFRDENEILERQTNPERYYIDVLMPQKIQLNMQFIRERTLRNYFSIIFRTLRSI